MKKVKHVSATGKYQLHVEFEDGVVGTIDLTDRLFGPVFEPLKDESIFKQVQVDEFGAICWPCGADLAPDALYEKLNASMQPA